MPYFMDVGVAGNADLHRRRCTSGRRLPWFSPVPGTDSGIEPPETREMVIDRVMALDNAEFDLESEVRFVLMVLF